jgi:two-component system, cell cycle sensor histidine kinase and response regulator CckA
MHNACVAVSMHVANTEREALGDPACASLALAFNVGVPTILLVEDDAFVCDVAYEVLRSAGYRVLAARNAATAVRAFRSHTDRVQLLLTDVVLPDRDGCDLALELGTSESGLKAIFISGYSENCITRKGIRHPGWFYLPKPFSALSLLRRVKEALNDLPMR